MDEVCDVLQKLVWVDGVGLQKADSLSDTGIMCE